MHHVNHPFKQQKMIGIGTHTGSDQHDVGMKFFQVCNKLLLRSLASIRQTPACFEAVLPEVGEDLLKRCF